MRSRYQAIDGSDCYFVTSTIVGWIPVFTSRAYFDILIESLRFCQQNKGTRLFAYVILDNHFHLVAACPSISRTMADLKKYSARQIILQLRSDNNTWLLDQFSQHKKRYTMNSSHQVWQEGYHPEAIISQEMLIQKIEYIHGNPVKRGIVTCPEQWPYSSAGYHLLGHHSLLELESLPL